eukprot:scpid101137/ scgid25334/ 
MYQIYESSSRIARIASAVTETSVEMACSEPSVLTPEVHSDSNEKSEEESDTISIVESSGQAASETPAASLLDKLAQNGKKCENCSNCKKSVKITQKCKKIRKHFVGIPTSGFFVLSFPNPDMQAPYHCSKPAF